MDTAQNIALTATGGSEAAAALDGVSTAMHGIESAHDALKDKFSRGFTNVALYMFMRQSMDALNLGRETYRIITLMDTALMTLGSAGFGAAASTIMLVGSALATLVGVMDKVSTNSEKQYAALDKLTESHKKEYDETEKVVGSIQDYVKETGTVPDYLKRWEDSENNLAAAQKSRVEITERQEIDVATKAMNAARERTEQLKDEIAEQQQLASTYKATYSELGNIDDPVGKLKSLQDEYDKQTMSVLQYKAKIDQLIASLKLLQANGTDDLDKLTQAHQKAGEAAKKQADEQDKANKKIKKDLDDQAAASYAAFEVQKKQNEVLWNDMEKVAGSAINSVIQAQSQGFAKMVVEGGKFSDWTKNLWKDLAEQVIAQIEAMIVKMMVLYALTGGQGMAFNGEGGTTGVAKLLGFAAGGTSIVDHPTTFVAGDGGEPEIVSVTPASQVGSGTGGGNNITIQMENHFNGITDPDEIAATIGDKIVSNIRGRGNIAFARTA